MAKISRNDPCWCGSGVKYKKCHWPKLGPVTKSGVESGPTISRKQIDKPVRKIIKKSAEQIEGIRAACHATRSILDLVASRIGVGVTTNEINSWVHEATLEMGGVPATLNYRGYPKSVCTSINEVICHGIPCERKLVDGDIINVDVTTILDDFYGDASRMFKIGTVSKEADDLVRVTQECLDLGLAEVRVGKCVGDIGFAIQQHAEGLGYSVVRDYCGHGCGADFHEPPEVRHYGKPGTGARLEAGMTFTIEPMINIGTHACKTLGDNWTVVTADNSLSAQWEHLVLVTDGEPDILTA